LVATVAPSHTHARTLRTLPSHILLAGCALPVYRTPVAAHARTRIGFTLPHTTLATCTRTHTHTRTLPHTHAFGLPHTTPHTHTHTPPLRFGLQYTRTHAHTTPRYCTHTRFAPPAHTTHTHTFGYWFAEDILHTTYIFALLVHCYGLDHTTTHRALVRLTPRHTYAHCGRAYTTLTHCTHTTHTRALHTPRTRAHHTHHAHATPAAPRTHADSCHAFPLRLHG